MLKEMDLNHLFQVAFLVHTIPPLDCAADRGGTAPAPRGRSATSNPVWNTYWNPFLKVVKRDFYSQLEPLCESVPFKWANLRTIAPKQKGLHGMFAFLVVCSTEFRI